MAAIIIQIYKNYRYAFEHLADDRIKDYPLMSTMTPILLILGSYLFFVLKLGPQLMKNRRPFKLDFVLIVFNISQIGLCAYLVYEFMIYCFFQVNWFCEPIDYSDTELTRIHIFYFYIYFCIKILDLLDTVFFVLRKKNRQISFLHVYHHAGMVMLGWVGCKFLAGGQGIFVGFINCIVHVFMYIYYLISSIDNKYKKSIWWKKYITQLQMIQFFLMAVSFIMALVQPNCTYPKWVIVLFLPQNCFIFLMFADFYWRAYIKNESH